MPDRDVSTIRDLNHYQNAKSIAKSAVAAFDGAQGPCSSHRLKHRGDKKSHDSTPPLLEKKYLKTDYNCLSCSGTLDQGDLDGDNVITVLDIR
jgi:hypothetical protein